MKRYCINPNNLVYANEKNILFYTPTNPPGIISTALWKYQTDTGEIHRCFEINRSMIFWKYSLGDRETDLQYIGIQYPGASCVIGLGSHGERIFSIEPGKIVDISGPAFDMFGNIYLAVDERWIFCLSPEGKVLWKWKAMFAIPGVSEIEKYWVNQDKLYVITCGLLYVISMSGKVEESHLIYEFPYKPIQCQICGEYILLIDMRSRDLLCYDLRGEKIWQFNAGIGEMILRIISCEHNRICLKVIRHEDNASVLYVLNENGEVCWSLCEKWDELYISPAQEIVLLSEKEISIYSSEGKNTLKSSVKKSIIYANVWGNCLRMIVESRGKIAVIEQDREMKMKPVVIKLPDVEENEAIEENGISWENELIETIMMNLQLFSRYFQGEILKIRIACELFSFMHISVWTDKGTWENAMAGSIFNEEVTEEDRDSYKECCYRNDTIWTEFCDTHSEKEIKSIMGAVCDSLGQRGGIEVDLWWS